MDTLIIHNSHNFVISQHVYKFAMIMNSIKIDSKIEQKFEKVVN